MSLRKRRAPRAARSRPPYPARGALTRRLPRRARPPLRYARSASAPADEDVVLAERQAEPRARAFLPSGRLHMVVKVFDGLGAYTRHVLAEETRVEVQVEMSDAAVDGVLDAAASGSAAEQQQLCAALSAKLNLAAPLRPPRGHEGPHPRELEPAELAKQTQARGRMLDMLATSADAPAEAAKPMSGAKVGQVSATVAAVVARPEQLDSSSQVTAAGLVRRLADSVASTGLADNPAAGAALASSLSSLLSTNASALEAGQHAAVSAAVLSAAHSLGSGALQGVLPDEEATHLSSPKLNVTAKRASAHKLGNSRIGAPGDVGGGVVLPSRVVDPHSADAQGGVDVTMVSFGRNVHRDPAELAAEAGAAGEALRHTVSTQVFGLSFGSAEKHGAKIEVKGLAEPVIIELHLGASAASQRGADPAANAANLACVDAHMRAHAAAMAGSWLWFNGSAVNNAREWGLLRARALADPSTAEEALARYGEQAEALAAAPADLPGGPEGEALRLGRARGEVLSTRSLVYAMALECPQPAAAACQYWDEARGLWSTEGCAALPRLPEYSYGLHLLDGGEGAEAEGARVVRCACTHLTDFAGLSIPLTKEELLEQITAVHVNTFSLHDFGDALTHFDYAQNAAIYDLVFTLAGANAVVLALACVWDRRIAQRRAAEQKRKVVEAIAGSEAARLREEERIRALAKRRAARAAGAPRAEGDEADAEDMPAWSRVRGSAVAGRLLGELRGVLSARLRDEHTVAGVFFSSTKAFSRAQLVQIFFNVLAVELVTECMLYAPDDDPADAEAAWRAGRADELVASGMDAEQAAALAAAQDVPELAAEPVAVVTYMITSIITSAVCLPAIIAFKQFWFLYEWWPFSRCLVAVSRNDRELAATRIQSAQRMVRARKERRLREMALLNAPPTEAARKRREALDAAAAEARRIEAEVAELQAAGAGAPPSGALRSAEAAARKRLLAAREALRELQRKEEERAARERAKKREAAEKLRAAEEEAMERTGAQLAALDDEIGQLVAEERALLLARGGAGGADRQADAALRSVKQRLFAQRARRLRLLQDDLARRSVSRAAVRRTAEWERGEYEEARRLDDELGAEAAVRIGKLSAEIKALGAHKAALVQAVEAQARAGADTAAAAHQAALLQLQLNAAETRRSRLKKQQAQRAAERRKADLEAARSRANEKVAEAAHNAAVEDVRLAAAAPRGLGALRAARASTRVGLLAGAARGKGAGSPTPSNSSASSLDSDALKARQGGVLALLSRPGAPGGGAEPYEKLLEEGGEVEGGGGGGAAGGRARSLIERRRERKRRQLRAIEQRASSRWVHLPLLYFQMLSWAFMFAAFGLCCALIVTFGLVLGPAASEDMLISWSIALGQTFFLHEPLMIGISSAGPFVLKLLLLTACVHVASDSHDHHVGIWEGRLDQLWEWLDYVASCE